MFNITFNLRKLVKRIGIIFFISVFTILIIILIKRFYKNIFNLIDDGFSFVLESELNYKNYKNISFEKGTQKILSSELILMGRRNEEIEISNEVIENEDKLENVEVVIESTNESIDYSNINTEVIKEKNLKEAYNIEFQGVKIKNESKYNLTDEILMPNIDFQSRDILIFHTHTCESYTQTEKNKYKESGTFRTIDLNYSVARVGDELNNLLVDKNFNVVHDTTYHDYPAYTGSYNRSRLTVKNILDNNPNIHTVIDLHRDAVGNNSNYGPAVQIGNDKVAQLMFVIGTDGGGLSHPNWKNNLKYAVKIQEKANEMFPGLFRPIIVRNSRYNQDLSDGACIIEVGATGNTLEECIRKYEIFSRSIR